MNMTMKPKSNHTNGEHFAAIKKITDKSKQELLAIPKSMFQKCFASISVLNLRDVEGDKIVSY